MNVSTRGLGSLGVMITLALVGTVTVVGCDDGEPTDGGMTDGSSMDGASMDGSDDAADPARDGSDADGSESSDGGGADTDTGRPSVYGECIQTCSRARDCGLAEEWVCEDSGYCDFHQCNADIDCVHLRAQWASEGCQVGDCEVEGDTCIQHNGTTYCAAVNTDGSCRGRLEITTKQKADGSGEVDVCVPKMTDCTDNTCQGVRGAELRCQTDSDCDGLTCNDRDKCACETDQQCIDAERGDNWECITGNPG